MNQLTVYEACLAHTVEAIGRTGAKQLEVGWLDDEPPHRWWASATFQGAKVTCENQEDSLNAVMGLYGLLACGAECATCHRPVALKHFRQGLVVAARMNNGDFETRALKRKRDKRFVCVRQHELKTGWSTCRRVPVPQVSAPAPGQAPQAAAPTMNLLEDQ